MSCGGSSSIDSPPARNWLTKKFHPVAVGWCRGTVVSSPCIAIRPARCFASRPCASTPAASSTGTRPRGLGIVLATAGATRPMAGGSMAPPRAISTRSANDSARWRAAARRSCRLTAHHAVEDGLELVHVDGLDQVCGKAGFLGALPVVILAPPGDGDQGDIAPIGAGADLFRRLKPIHDGHAQIEQHGCRLEALNLGDGGVAVMGDANLIAEQIQQAAEAVG